MRCKLNYNARERTRKRIKIKNRIIFFHELFSRYGAYINVSLSSPAGPCLASVSALETIAYTTRIY